MRFSMLFAALVAAAPGALAAPGAGDAALPPLAAEVRDRGWIAYSARSEAGDWDLFACRPDGSGVRHLTRSPEWHEFSPQFSRDGARLLYRRLPPGEVIDQNAHGTQGELVMANRDATEARVLKADRPLTWASWSPDGRQLATLSIKGISILDAASLAEVKRLERKGMFQQLTWSPDGEWLVGVANSYGTGWSVARIHVASGQANPVNLVDCCTPDWFPDSRRVLFSWRPPGQIANQGYGWTQLWMADAEGKNRQLLYGEDGRHVYGGHVSPDGKYVIFTGNMREDGDPGNAGAPMGLMRLTDAPIIGGTSEALRALHAKVNDGPVLVLPAGWEPCWTSAEIFGLEAPGSGRVPAPAHVGEEPKQALAAELRSHGWLVFSAPSPAGDWDIFRMRPDGSKRHALTSTSEFNEAGPRVSPDGRQMLYYRLPRGGAVNMTYGTRDLVIAAADGRRPVVWGDRYPWASWGPDAKRFACLTPAGVKPVAIQEVDLSTGELRRRFPTQHITQQLVWSPDGQWFLGTANRLGQYWNIGRFNLATGIVNAVGETDRFNCTADWTPDSKEVLYARGIDPARDPTGRAELWLASGDGARREMLFAEADRHLYGASASPDGRYCVFSRSADDFGEQREVSGFTLAVIRRGDGPMIASECAALRSRYPLARTGPWLDLGPGWEPHWTLNLVTESTTTRP